MLRKTTIDFLKNLKKNNNKEWFDANRTEYLMAKEDFEGLVSIIILQLTKIDARYGELKPKDCVFRINRDVRFSKDKSPYKTNMGAGFSIGGKKSNMAGFYLHIEPGQNFVGGGLWMPDADALKKIRQEIDYNFNEFKKIVEYKTFKTTYGGISMENSLKNPPKGYDIENKAIEYLKLKSFVTSKSILDSELLDKKTIQKVQTSFNTIAPFISFLNTAITD